MLEQRYRNAMIMIMYVCVRVYIYIYIYMTNVAVTSKNIHINNQSKKLRETLR